MEDDELVLAEIEVVEGFHNLFRVVEQVADEDEEAAFRDALGDIMQNRGGIGIDSGFRLVQDLQNAADLARTACGTDEIQRLVIEGDEARGVALFDVEIGERGGEILRVFEF